MSYFDKKNIALFLIAGIAIVGIPALVVLYFAENTSEDIDGETRREVPKQENGGMVQPQKEETTTQMTKLYRNEEWGFEFNYPEDWTFEINSFYNPSSKFNLQGNSSAEKYNVLVPHFLLNIVTTKFADQAVINRRARGALESNITVGGVVGKKFQHKTGYSEKVSIDLPFDKYRIILALVKSI